MHSRSSLPIPGWLPARSGYRMLRSALVALSALVAFTVAKGNQSTADLALDALADAELRRAYLRCNCEAQRRRSRRAATNPIQPSRPHPGAARLLVSIPTARLEIEPADVCFTWRWRLSPSNASASRHRLAAAQSLGLAVGHRYNRRLLQGRSESATTDHKSLWTVIGELFNCWFKSAA